MFPYVHERFIWISVSLNERWVFYFLLMVHFNYLKVYKVTECFSSSRFKSYSRLSDSQKIEWNNR